MIAILKRFGPWAAKLIGLSGVGLRGWMVVGGAILSVGSGLFVAGYHHARSQMIIKAGENTVEAIEEDRAKVVDISEHYETAVLEDAEKTRYFEKRNEEILDDLYDFESILFDADCGFSDDELRVFNKGNKRSDFIRSE